MSFLSNKFDDIPCDGRIKTDRFLECCDEIVKFFDGLGTVFKPVKSDIEYNILKIRTRYLEDKIKFGTLPDIIDTEAAETDKKHKVGKNNEGIATNALVWLHRGLKYIYFFFLHLVSGDYVTQAYPDKNSLQNCAKLAYEESLKKFHNFIIKGVFNMAMKAAPNRDAFMERISGCKDNDDETLKAITEFNVNFDKTIKNIEALVREKKVIFDE